MDEIIKGDMSDKDFLDRFRELIRTNGPTTYQVHYDSELGPNEVTIKGKMIMMGSRAKRLLAELDEVQKQEAARWN